MLGKSNRKYLILIPGSFGRSSKIANENKRVQVVKIEFNILNVLNK